MNTKTDEVNIGVLTEGFTQSKQNDFTIFDVKKEVYNFFRISKSEIELPYFEKKIKVNNKKSYKLKSYLKRKSNKDKIIRIHKPGSRERNKVEIRQIAMAICYDMRSIKKWSLKEIGENIGGYDHSTVFYAVRNVRNLYDTNKEYHNNFDRLQLIIKGKFLL